MEGQNININQDNNRSALFSKNILVILFLIIIVAVISSLFTYYFLSSKLNKQSLTGTESSNISPTKSTILPSSTQTSFIEISPTIPSNSIPPKAVKGNKIAMVKNAQVIIKNLDNNEEISTNIPIRWEDPNATWCQGFDWSADGSKIIAPRIKKIFDLKTKTLQEFPLQDKNIASFQWNPISNSLYYSQATPKGTWLLTLDTFSKQQISLDSMVSTNYNHLISLDGKKMIIQRDTGDRDKFGNIINKYIVLDLINKNETEIIPPSNTSKRLLILLDFAWSPTNDEVAYFYYMNTNDDEEAISETYRAIAVFNLNTKKSTKLPLPFSSARMPNYSPDGKYIIFENEDALQELWRVNSDGSNPIKLSEKLVDFDMLPNWSPDSKKIVFTKYEEGVVIIDQNGNNKQIIDGKAECAIWTP